jgi:hypothetical protein
MGVFKTPFIRVWRLEYHTLLGTAISSNEFRLPDVLPSIRPQKTILLKLILHLKAPDAPLSKFAFAMNHKNHFPPYANFVCNYILFS